MTWWRGSRGSVILEEMSAIGLEKFAGDGTRNFRSLSILRLCHLKNSLIGAVRK